MDPQAPQTFANHGRFDPLFHFVALPVFALTLIISVILLVKNPGWLTGWGVVLAVGALIAVFKIRLYALKVQDRMIRLEERLRLTGLLGLAAQPQIDKLSVDQLIALRFASDGEAPALVQRAVTENLSRADIKKAIKVWRPDYWRV